MARGGVRRRRFPADPHSPVYGYPRCLGGACGARLRPGAGRTVHEQRDDGEVAARTRGRDPLLPRPRPRGVGSPGGVAERMTDRVSVQRGTSRTTTSAAATTSCVRRRASRPGRPPSDADPGRAMPR